MYVSTYVYYIYTSIYKYLAVIASVHCDRQSVVKSLQNEVGGGSPEEVYICIDIHVIHIIYRYMYLYLSVYLYLAVLVSVHRDRQRIVELVYHVYIYTPTNKYKYIHIISTCKYMCIYVYLHLTLYRYLAVIAFVHCDRQRVVEPLEDEVGGGSPEEMCEGAAAAHGVVLVQHHDAHSDLARHAYLHRSGHMAHLFIYMCSYISIHVCMHACMY